MALTLDPKKDKALLKHFQAVLEGQEAARRLSQEVMELV